MAAAETPAGSELLNQEEAGNDQNTEDRRDAAESESLNQEDAGNDQNTEDRRDPAESESLNQEDTGNDQNTEDRRDAAESESLNQEDAGNDKNTENGRDAAESESLNQEDTGNDKNTENRRDAANSNMVAICLNCPPFESIVEEVSENKVFSACVLINALLILSILVVTISWLSFAVTDIVDFDPAPGLYCMKCDKVESGVDKKNYFYIVEGDKCCSDKDGKYLEYVLSKHINKTLNEEFREKTVSPSFFCSVEPLFQLCLNDTTAQHLSAYVKTIGVQRTIIYKNNLSLIYWDSKHSNNFFNNIIYSTTGGVDKTGFQVKRAGYYHIYSNLVFDLKNEKDTFPAIIRHLVLKFRKDYDVGETLLEGYYTQCDTIGDTTFSSFLFGDFYITETDWVQVFVNGDIYLNPTTPYFGMFLI